MSEASGTVAQTLIEQVKPGSVGQLLPNWEARVGVPYQNNANTFVSRNLNVNNYNALLNILFSI